MHFYFCGAKVVMMGGIQRRKGRQGRGKGPFAENVSLDLLATRNSDCRQKWVNMVSDGT
jgi:hypothetical protein